MILEYIVRVEDEFYVTLEDEEDMVEIIWNYGRLLKWLMEDSGTALP